MIALDATYSVGEHLSGVGVYSRELLNGLAARGGEWEWFFRHKAFLKAGKLPGNVERRMLLERFGSRSAPVFHGLNQRLPKRPFRRQVSTFHDLFVLTAEYSTPEFRERFAAQARHAAQSSDLLIAVSQFTARQLEDEFHIPPSRIHVVHHGIVPRSLPKLSRQKVVLCVGAIQARKNQARLVQAFRALPEDWHLVLAGSNGYQAEETLAEIRTSPAANRIHVTGYLNEAELAEWYAKASIFAFPSLDEGFGMPVLEAMAAGIPVMTSNRSSLPEVAGDAAILIDPMKVDQIADALQQLITNCETYALLVQRGRERVRQFSWQKAIEATEKLYEILL